MHVTPVSLSDSDGDSNSDNDGGGDSVGRDSCSKLYGCQ